MAEAGSDSPPPYYSLKEDKTEQNATEVTIPESHDASETPEVYGILFEHKDNRIGFTQKVLLIKLVQVFALTIFLAVFILEPLPIYMALEYDRINMIVLSSLLLLVVLVLIHMCDKYRVTRPYNYMFLAVYPLSVAFFFSSVTSVSGRVEIAMSWIYFNFVVFALLVYSIFALQSKIEFKTKYGLYIAAAILIVSYALTVPFLYDINAFNILYCSLSMFGLTAYMLYDIQIMVSRSYRIHLSPSDCVKAAVTMHIDYRYMITEMIRKLFNYNNDDVEVINTS